MPQGSGDTAPSSPRRAGPAYATEALARGWLLSRGHQSSRRVLSSVAVYNIESGRSRNPQRKTVEKLEKALGKQLSPKAKKEAEEEATIGHPGSWPPKRSRAVTSDPVALHCIPRVPLVVAGPVERF
jgi:hypothetical protein